MNLFKSTRKLNRVKICQRKGPNLQQFFVNVKMFAPCGPLVICPRRLQIQKFGNTWLAPPIELNMNCKTFLFAFWLSIAAVKAAESEISNPGKPNVKPVQSEIENSLKIQEPIIPNAITDFEDGIKDTMDELNQQF